MDTPPTNPFPAHPTPDPTLTPAHPHLTAYLADHDAPCPHCRYNLRGVSGCTCPECGKPIELALSAPSRFGGRGLFLIVALLVVLVGGSIAATRQWQSVRTTATGGSFLMGGTPLRITTSANGLTTVLTSSGRVTTTPNSTGTITLSAPNITINNSIGNATVTPASPATPSARAPVAATTVSRLLTTTRASPFAPVGALTPAPPTWSAVTFGQWSLLGMWSLLALAALATLLLLLVLRARKNAPSPRWLRTLSAASISLLVLFGAAHITLFITDLLR